MVGFPSCSLTIFHFQDTTVISGPGSSFPTGITENSPGSMGTELIIPALAVTLPQTSPWPTPPGGSPGSAHFTQQLFWLTGPRTLEAGSTPYIEQPLASSEGELTSLSKELLQVQEEMNIPLEELLEVRASMDYCHREQDLGAELAHVIMMPSLPKPRHTTQPQPLPCNGLTWTAFQHWTKKWWQRRGKEVLNGPLSLSTGGPLDTCVPPTIDWWHSLSPPLGMPAAAWLQATTDTGSTPALLTLSVSDASMPQPSIKQWCHSSNQGMPNPGQNEEKAPDDMPEQPPQKVEANG